MANAIPTLKMLWQTMVIFAGLVALVMGNQMNTTSSASPKVQMSTTTTPTPTSISTSTSTPPPPFAAVMDIFQAPLAAFKPNVDDKTNPQMGRDQQNSAGSQMPSNIFFKAGSGIGSAASSLTGWFNNRVIPQALRPASTTTPAPELMFEIIPNNQVKRKIVLATNNRRKPLRNRPRPVLDDSDDLDEFDEQFNNEDDEEDDLNSNFDMVEDDDEDDYEPVEKRKGSKKSQKRPNQQYYYIEEENLDGDDEFDLEEQMPKRKPQRKQQNLNNIRRKTPPKKKQQKKRKPTRRVQQPQIVQVLQNSAYQSQNKRKRRPSTTFELVPISQNQAISSITKKKPSSFGENSQQKPASQYLNIPWTSLGLAGPPRDPTSNDQQTKPIIVRIPQQSIKRKRRPNKKQTVNVVKNQKNSRRKPFRGQLQNQSPVFSILSDDEVREIFKAQLTEPSQMTQQASNSEMSMDKKKNLPKQDSDEMSLQNNNNDNNNDTEQNDNVQAQSEGASNEEDSNDSFIVVGPADDEDDKEIDTGLYRHLSNYRGFKRGRAEPKLSQRTNRDSDHDDES